MHFTKLSARLLEKNESYTNSLLLPKNLQKQLKLYDGDQVKIIWGTKNVNCNIRNDGPHFSGTFLSKDVYETLDIPILSKIQLHYCQITKTVFIGPIIGIMTEIKHQNGEPPSFSIINFCEELSLYSQSLGTYFFVYSPKELANDYPTGYFFHNKQWVKVTTPYPHVIYNRIHSKKMEKSQFVKDLKHKWTEKNIPFFNFAFLSKLDMYSLLFEESFFHYYIPKGKPLTVESLREFLSLYSAIFIKPNFGSQGTGIIKIVRAENGLILKTNGEEDIVFQEQEECIHFIEKNIDSQNFMIQEGINLVTIQDRPVDFRFLCHRLDQNKWDVTFSVARISNEGSFVSNIAKGGELASPKIVLRQIFLDKADSIYQTMKELSISVCKAIQSKNHHYAELGIDLGVDTKGKAKLIEINSKPSKTVGTNHTSIRPSVKAIFNYCHYCGLMRLEECCLCDHLE